LINCQKISCFNNQLTELSDLNNCRELNCYNNLLPYANLENHTKIIRFKKLYLGIKYIRKWRLFKTNSIINKKKDLLLELLFSPDLNFYKLHPYYLHFIQKQNN